MKKYVSLLTLITVLFATAGCGSKKQAKTTQAKQIMSEKQAVVDTTMQDKKEDYTIAA